MGGDAPDASDEGASWLCPLSDLWPDLLETEEAVSDGLREALGGLADKWEGMETPALSMPSNQEWAKGVDDGYDQAADDLRGALADHPAPEPFT